MSNVSYYHVTISCPGPSNVITALESTPDHSVACREKLKENDIDFYHAYYWPGDHYYAYVRVNEKHEETKAKLRDLCIAIEEISESHSIANGLTIKQLFQNKDNLKLAVARLKKTRLETGKVNRTIPVKHSPVT